MGMPRAVDTTVRDMFIEADEAELRKDPVWRHYLNKMGSQTEFSASEVAAILRKPTTDDVYKFVDSGELRGVDMGTGGKRYVTVTRDALKAFIGSRMT